MEKGCFLGEYYGRDYGGKSSDTHEKCAKNKYMRNYWSL